MEESDRDDSGVLPGAAAATRRESGGCGHPERMDGCWIMCERRMKRERERERGGERGGGERGRGGTDHAQKQPVALCWWRVLFRVIEAMRGLEGGWKEGWKEGKKEGKT